MDQKCLISFSMYVLNYSFRQQTAEEILSNTDTSRFKATALSFRQNKTNMTTPFTWHITHGTLKNLLKCVLQM